VTGPQNNRYQRRFTDPASRLLPNDRNLARFDKATRDRITDMLLTLDGWAVVAEAERATKADAERQERMRGWESSGEIRRGDPGE
jgi:hypothetical protein